MGFGLVHTGLLLASLLIAWLAGWVALVLTRRARGWGDRRTFQLFCLGVPVLVVSALGAALVSMLVRGCSLFTPLDTTLSVLILSAGGAMLVVSMATTGWRSWAARRLLDQIAEPLVDARVEAILRGLAQKLDVAAPRLNACRTEYPLACVTGIRQPELILSTWMLTNLDDGELEAVLAHELAHLRHGDNLVAWMAAWLKEGLFYLPTASRAWAEYQADREVVSDSIAVRATGKPLAMASALVKVWQQGLSTSTQRPFQAIETVASFGEEADASIETRIQRLLTDPVAAAGPAFGPLSWAIPALGLLLVGLVLIPLYWMPSPNGGSCLFMPM